MRLSAKKAFFGHYVFNICEEVYEPAEDSFLFAEHLQLDGGERVLDVGAGSGILGIIAAEQASEVVAVDINPHAIRCARQNALLNGVGAKMFFVQGDLFEPFSAAARFDLVLFNAPYVPSEDGETEFWLGRAWSGGITGRKVIDRFISQSSNRIEKKGKILLMQSTLAGVDETIKEFAAFGLKAAVVAERPLPFFETLTLLKAQYST